MSYTHCAGLPGYACLPSACHCVPPLPICTVLALHIPGCMPHPCLCSIRVCPKLKGSSLPACPVPADVPHTYLSASSLPKHHILTCTPPLSAHPIPVYPLHPCGALRPSRASRPCAPRPCVRAAHPPRCPLCPSPGEASGEAAAAGGGGLAAAAAPRLPPPRPAAGGRAPAHLPALRGPEAPRTPRRSQRRAGAAAMQARGGGAGGLRCTTPERRGRRMAAAAGPRRGTGAPLLALALGLLAAAQVRVSGGWPTSPGDRGESGLLCSGEAEGTSRGAATRSAPAATGMLLTPEPGDSCPGRRSGFSSARR